MKIITAIILFIFCVIALFYAFRHAKKTEKNISY